MGKNKLFLCAFVSLLFIISGCSRQQLLRSVSSKDEYKIAVAAPQFGPYQALGLSIVHGAEFAVDLKNASGGINGKKITLVKVDDGGLAGEGTLKAKNLVSEMVLGVIGHLNSDISIPASEIYAKAMMVQISPGSTNPFFTERLPVKGYVFRTVGRDDKLGSVASEFVLKRGFKKLAVLYNNRSYGFSLSSEFVKKINEAMSAEIVSYRMYEVGKVNLLEEIEIIKNKNPDLVFFAGEYGDAAKLLKKMRESGLNTAFLGGEAVFSEEFVKDAMNYAEGAFVVSLPLVSDKEFIENYKKRFGSELSAYSANSFDAANILISAIEKVREKNPERIAKVISETKDFNGLTGKITFDSKGDLLDPQFSVYEVKMSMFEVVR